MGFNDFWINNNGKREKLNDTKHGVRKEQVDQKFHNLFDAYDVNQDGTLEEEELTGIFKGLSKFAGADKVLDSKENAQVKSVFSQQVNIQDADFQGFVKSISDASADIKSTKTTATPDGGKEVRTEYADGTVETISYYPDGDYKFKKTELHKNKTVTTYTMDGKQDKQYSSAQIEQKIKADYKKYKQQIASQNASNRNKDMGVSISYTMPYEEFKNSYMRKHNVCTNTRQEKIDIDNLDLSERAKQDVEVRDFVLNHYIETHKAAKEALETMGILDDAGAAINAGAGELWNSIKNVWNGTEEEYQNFYELKEKFEPNYNKSLSASGSLEVMRNHPENYFRGFEKEMPNYTLEKGVTFQAKTEQYQNATILKQRMKILEDAMREISMYDAEQTALVYAPVQNEGSNPASHIVKANKLLLQYFGGDQEAVNMILNGTFSDADKVIKAIKDILTETQKMNESVLGGKSFDEIEGEYKTAYKEMYGTDFVPDELTEKVMDAKATGSFVKLAAITIISVLITRSPIMAEISGAAAGSAEATGAAANLMRTLVTKYGQTAVQQGIKFAMTSGTLATDVGLTLLNQVTSERGVNGEELWESTKSSAKYIYFGSYIGAPIAEAVGGAISKVGMTKALFSGGSTTTQGAIQTTTIQGEKVLENLFNAGKSWGAKALVTGAKLGTDIGMFTALEVATNGEELGDALKEQSTFLPKLKIMNAVLEYGLGRLMGGKVNAQMRPTERPMDLRMEEAIKRSGVKDWVVKEMKSPTGTRISVIDENGMPQSYSDKGQLVTAMLERVAKAYEEVKIDTPETQVKVETNEDISIPTQAEVKQMNFDEMFARLKNGHVNYTLSTTEDGRKLVKIEDYKTPSSNRFDYYEFDNEGKLVKSQVKTSEATAKDLFKSFENAETRNIHNRGGRLNIGVPVKDMAESVDAAITARNVRIEVGNNDNQLLNADVVEAFISELKINLNSDKLNLTTDPIKRIQIALESNGRTNSIRPSVLKILEGLNIDKSLPIEQQVQILRQSFEQEIKQVEGEYQYETTKYEGMKKHYSNNPTALRNFDKLKNAGLSSAAMADFHRLMVLPEEVVDKFIELGRLPDGTADQTVLSLMSTVYSSDKNAPLKENYLEIIDMISDLKNMEVKGKKFSIMEISALLNSSEYNTEKLDKILDFMTNVDVDIQKYSSINAIPKLLQIIEEKPEMETTIKDLFKLTPEQLKARKGKYLSPSFILMLLQRDKLSRTRFAFEKQDNAPVLEYTPEQREIIKNFYCSEGMENYTSKYGDSSDRRLLGFVEKNNFDPVILKAVSDISKATSFHEDLSKVVDRLKDEHGNINSEVKDVLISFVEKLNKNNNYSVESLLEILNVHMVGREKGYVTKGKRNSIVTTTYTVAELKAKEEIADLLTTDKFKDFSSVEKHAIISYTNDGNINFIKEQLQTPENKNSFIIMLYETSRSNLQYLDSKNIEALKENVEYQRQKVNEAPDKYVNGEFTSDEDRQQAIDEFFEENYGSLMVLSSVYDKEAFNNMLRMRFDDVEDYIRTFGQFSPKELDLVSKLSNSTNIDGKPFMPTQKIEFIDLIQAYKVNNLSVDKIEHMIEEGKVDLAELRIDLFNQILRNSGLSDEEIASVPKEKLTAWDTKYAHLLSKEIQEEKDVAFSDVLRAGNLYDFHEFINDENNEYGKANAVTRQQYAELGMDYDKWYRPLKESEVHFQAKDNNLEQLEQIETQFLEDIETLRKTPVKGFIDKQYPKCIKNGEFIIPPEFTTSKAKMTEFINGVIKALEPVWTRAKGNLDNPQRAQTAQNTLTILDHFNQRLSDIEQVKEIQRTKGFDVTIKMWDRIPQKDIFQGNYSTCCIGMGGGNGTAMPYFLMDTAYNMIEIVDSKGKTIGNALCYFVKEADGKPAFIIDNIEINNAEKPSSEIGIQLRNAIAEYAANVARDVVGEEGTNIYMSKNYNDVPFDDLPVVEGTKVQFIGDVNRDEIYMDLYEGWVDKSQFTEPQETQLFKLGNSKDIATVKEEVKTEEVPSKKKVTTNEQSDKAQIARDGEQSEIDDFILQIQNAKSEKECDQLKRRIANLKKSVGIFNKNQATLYALIDVQGRLIELRKLVDDECMYDSFLAECTEKDGKYNTKQLKQKINFIKLNKLIDKLQTTVDCNDFERKLSDNSLKDADLAKLQRKYETRKAEIQRTEEMAAQGIDPIAYVNMTTDKENISLLSRNLEKVTSLADCEYLESKVRDIIGISTQTKSLMLNMIREKKAEFSDEVSSSYLIDRVREDMGKRLYSYAYLDSPFGHLDVSFKDYDRSLDNYLFNEMRSNIAKCSSEKTNVNIHPIGNSSLRGQNIISLPEYMFDAAQDLGLKCIIDLRGNIGDEIDIKKDRIRKDGEKTFIDNVEYFKFPVDHEEEYYDTEIIQNLGKFFEKMDDGSFYIGCANGLHRTDFTLALNYVLNTKTRELPKFWDSNVHDLKDGVRRIYEKIEKIRNAQTFEDLEKIGFKQDEQKKCTFEEFKQGILKSLPEALPKTEEEFNKRLSSLRC